jgi:hypothetical protein
MEVAHLYGQMATNILDHGNLEEDGELVFYLVVFIFEMYPYQAN